VSNQTEANLPQERIRCWCWPGRPAPGRASSRWNSPAMGRRDPFRRFDAGLPRPGDRNAQPAAREREDVPHYLVGHVAPTDLYDAARLSRMRRRRSRKSDPREAADGRRRHRDVSEIADRGPVYGAFARSGSPASVAGRAADKGLRRSTRGSPKSIPKRRHESSRATRYGSCVRSRCSRRPDGRFRGGSRKAAGAGLGTRAIRRRHARSRGFVFADRRAGRPYARAGWVDEVRGLLAAGVPEDAPGFRALATAKCSSICVGRCRRRNSPTRSRANRADTRSGS